MAKKIGQSKSFYRKFRFQVDIDGIGSSKWTKCSELSSETAKIEQWEGGSLIPIKGVGRITFSDVTLERGATADRDLWNWYKETSDAAANAGDVDDDYKRNADIVQMDRDGKTLMRWNVANAFGIKFVAGEWDNGADENVMNSITLTYDYFDNDG